MDLDWTGSFQLDPFHTLGASTATTNQQPGPESPSLDPPPQQGRIQATYLGRSRQRRDVSHPSRPIVSCSWNRLRTNGLGSLPPCGECGDVGEITDLPETGATDG